MANVVGFFVAHFLFLVFVVALLFIGAGVFVSHNKPVATLEKNTILHLKLNHPIKEQGSRDPLENLDWLPFIEQREIGLNVILDAIEQAAEDEHVRAILLDLSELHMGAATLESVRDALIAFQDSEKPIFAYSNHYSQAAYYLASVADHILLNKEGGVEFKGLSLTQAFLKGTLDKLNIEPQIIRHGKYKSAVEPLIQEKMSEENRQQLKQLLDSDWHYLLEQISQSRNIEQSVLQNLAAELKINHAQDALEFKLVDQLVYRDELMAIIQKELHMADAHALHQVSLNQYLRLGMTHADKTEAAHHIAIVYAEGEIVDASREKRNVIEGEDLASTLRDIREDKDIHAVVLRINSPGGSALASEVIWREVDLLKQKKPVVVSMGDYAASGGYYIASPAQVIVAQPTTLTGSIGVFGVMFNGGDFLQNKLGVSTDTVKTSPFADIGSFHRRLQPEEYAFIHRQIEKVYDTFIGHVAAGRRITKEQVDAIGQGRVWSGVDAKRVGLVDKLGGIDTAVESAANLAQIDHFDLVEYPEEKGLLQGIIDEMGAESHVRALKKIPGASALFQDLKFIESLNTQSKIQTRLYPTIGIQ